jgi:hypothetical protein
MSDGGRDRVAYPKEVVQFLSLDMATACADEITLPRSGRVGRLNGRGGSLLNAEAVVAERGGGRCIMLKKTLSGPESPTLPQAGECCVRKFLQNKDLTTARPLAGRGDFYIRVG